MSIKERIYIYNNSTNTKEYQDELFTYIWNRYQHNIKLIINKYGMKYSFEDKEDYCNEVFIKIFNTLSLYNPLYSFNTWIDRVIRNFFIDLSRTKKNIHQHIEVDTIRSSLKNPEEQTMEAYELNELQKAAAELGTVDKKVFDLKFVQHKSYQEIAERLDISEGALRVRILRIRRKLKQLLGGDDEEN